MTRINNYHVYLAYIILSAITLPLSAQIITDGSMGARSTLSGSNYLIPAELGQQLGENLFHSFAQFSLYHGESATFTTTPDINNIFSRVTGLEPSFIAGSLHTNNANLYLMNPNGIIFNDQASLDIQGSFYATTADMIQFADGHKFHANLSIDSMLSSAAALDFGFLQTGNKGIEIQAATDLRLPRGQNLTLFTNKLSITDSLLAAGGAAINLIADEININSSSITANTSMTDNSAGEIVIRAGKFIMQNSTLNTTTTNNILVKGGNIDLHAQDINLHASRLLSETSHTTTGGDIKITADNLNIEAASRLSSATSIGGGDGGAIIIAAHDATIQQASTLQATTLGAGDAGQLSINAKQINILDGSKLIADTHSSGKSGDIYLQAENIILAGTNDEIGSSITAASLGRLDIAGSGGSITIQTGAFSLTDGSFLTTNTIGKGNAGNINIQVQNDAILSGRSARTDSGISSAAARGSTGSAGNIVLAVGENLFMDDFAIIDVSTFGSGDGGNLWLSANKMRMRNQAYIGAASADSGRTGNIYLELGDSNLEMYQQSFISTAATKSDGGDIYLKIPQYLYMDHSDITTSINSGVGGGGNIKLDAEFILLSNAHILAQAYGGPGGNIDILTTSVYSLSKQPLEELINASSQLGVDGVVRIRAPDSDLQEGLLLLNTDFLQTGRLLRSICDQRYSQNLHSLVVTGRESYPSLTDDWLPSNAVLLLKQQCN
jgi:filamentous hemagglutinin family protein